MRRIITGLALIPIVLLAAAPMAHASNERGAKQGKWLLLAAPTHDDPIVVDVCGFEGVQIWFSDQKEYGQLTDLPDGTLQITFTGKLVVAIQAPTGRLITANVSGPGMQLFHPDGSAVLDAQGNNLLILPLHEGFDVPDLVVTSGPVLATFDPNGALVGFTHQGTLTDLCAELVVA